MKIINKKSRKYLQRMCSKSSIKTQEYIYSPCEANHQKKNLEYIYSACEANHQ